MVNLRSLLSGVLTESAKKKIQQALLGYHSYAPSFSSAGEDMILRHILGSDKQDGFYVDIGAFHPVRFSNTYFFYLYGWRGINIEARPGSAEIFNKVRPKDINLEIGISRERGELTYYIIEEQTMNSFSRDFLEHIGMLNAIKCEAKVPVFPLSEVLDRYLPEGKAIDFMSVDVEGHDLWVLESNDWDRFRPKIVVVEDEQLCPQNSHIVRFMKQQGYALCVQNAIILNKVNEYFLIDETL
jgi:FkbM family methyltransferase